MVRNTTLILGFAALTLPAPSVASFTGNISPHTYSGPMAPNHAAEAQAKRLAGKRSASSRFKPTAGQISACANRPRFRAQHGANHPQVRKLEALCRQAGL